jgi:hypothetical protein
MTISVKFTADAVLSVEKMNKDGAQWPLVLDLESCLEFLASGQVQL